MRWLSLVVVCVASVATAAPKASNPAFLGIGMHDNIMPMASGQARSGPCIIDTVTAGGGAQAAGVMPGDVIERVDEVPIANCDALVETVTQREPSDYIKLDLRRGGMTRMVKARLTSRGEIFHHRYVGHAVPGTELIGLDDGRAIDLQDMKGRATIVGWFSPGCANCKQLLSKVADWVGEHRDRASALAVTHVSNGDDLSTATGRKQLQNAYSLALPLAMMAQSEAVGDDLLFSDRERATLMVIDCRGMVQYVAPIAADGSDTQAALDELFAAADQARLPRR